MDETTNTPAEAQEGSTDAPSTRSVDTSGVPQIKSKDAIRSTAAEHRAENDWIYIPEWETRVDVRRLTAGMNEECVAFARAGGEWSEYRRALKAIELGCIEPSFDLSNDDDYALLNESNPDTIWLLNNAIAILSNLREGSVADWQRRFPGPGQPALEAESGADTDLPELREVAE